VLARPARAPVPGPHNDLTDVAGVRVGHQHRQAKGWLTGVTVVLPPPGTVGSIDVRGAGPATRETDALAPTALVETVDAVCLCGGSAYGLAAADGVMGWLEERGVGYPVGRRPGQVVPIVAAAALFDLGAGGGWANRPDAAWGAAAADAAARRRLRQGNVGAGTGARTGLRVGNPVKGGLGSASVVLGDGTTVAALVAVNAGGAVADPVTGELYGLRWGLPGEFDELGPPFPDGPPPEAGRRQGDVLVDTIELDAAELDVVEGGPPRQTVLAVVATDARLAKWECYRLAAAGHDGMARAVSPIHGMGDGDTVFALATGRHELPRAPARPRPAQLGELMAASADVVTRAIVRGVVAARSAGGIPSYLDRYPSARR